MNLNLKNITHYVDVRARQIFWAVCTVLVLSAIGSRAATLTVTNTNDSGTGSLRDAIAAAGNGDTITFSLPSPSTITLIGGELPVTQSVAIVGPGPGSLAIEGNGTNAVFDLLGSSVGISGLTITNGQSGVYGGAGLVTISNVVITGNTGGGIYTTGADLIILNSTVSSNLGTGIYFTGPFYHTNTLSMTNTSVIGNLGGNGGGIEFIEGLNHIHADLSGVTIIGNRATGSGGGIYNNTDNLNLNNCVISSNSASGGGGASGDGGGIFADIGSVTTLNNVTMVGNVATNSGGAVCGSGGTSATFSHATLIGNSAGGGGAIANVSDGFNAGGSLSLLNSLVISNSASSGGAIYLQSDTYNITALISGSTVAYNQATNVGGAICNDVGGGNGSVTIVGSKIANNVAGTGGAIYSYARPEPGWFGNATLGITSSTFSGNSAGSGGAIYSLATGFRNGSGPNGALATMQILNSTFSNNVATNIAGGIYNQGTGATGAVSIVNSTFYNNSAASGGGGVYDTAAPINGSNGRTLLSVTNSTFNGNAAGTGGAVYNLSTVPIPPTNTTASAVVQLFNSTFSGNNASGNAGGIYNEGTGASSSVSVVNSTLYGNVAGSGGGGVYNSAAPLDGSNGSTLLGITNSTFSSNAAAIGGAIYNLCSEPSPPTNGFASAAVQMFNSTFADNSGTNGGGVFYNTNYGVGNAPVQIGSSILNAGPLGGTILNSAGLIISWGYNLSSDNAGGGLTTGTDLINTDPQLGPLQNNGGTVLTCALLPSSPAIDKGKNFSASAYDERGPGYTRTYDYPSVPNAVGGDGTDIGAFELQTAFDPFALWQFQNFGCTNCPQAAPSADPDGDGTDNLAEYLAGTNPNNASSVFRVLGVARQGNDLLVTWQTAGGHTNVLQSSDTLATGSFSDVSSNIVIPGTGDATSSYLESGAALGGTNSFYRVRLGQ